jgi:hypothetical protein
VAWRKPSTPPRIEPPEWFRNYHPEDWDDPDGQEQAMIDGCTHPWRPWPDAPEWPGAPGWPQFLHDIHARRRWGDAKHAYLRDHEDLAEQEFRDIQTRRYGRES